MGSTNTTNSDAVTRRRARSRYRAAALMAATVMLLPACDDSSGGADADKSAKAGEVTALSTNSPTPPKGAYARLTLRPQGPATDEQLLRAATIVRSRLAAAEVENSDVQVYAGQIVVTARGEGNTIPPEIGATAHLAFHPVLAAESQVVAPSSPGAARNGRPWAPPTPTPPPIDMTNPGANNGPADLTAFGVTAELQAEFAALDCPAVPETAKSADVTRPAALCAAEPESGAIEKFIVGPAAVDGTDISSAKAQLPSAGVGGWEVELRFDGAGTAKFTRITGDLAGGSYPTNRFAVVLDGRVHLAPAVSQELPGGEAVITGNFGKREAETMAALLASGALPISFERVEDITVPAASAKR